MDKQDVILIVDDEKEIADLVAVYLKGEGFAVQVCYNGNDAMDFIEQSPPQLALLDVMLPDADACDADHNVTTIETKEIPIVF